MDGISGKLKPYWKALLGYGLVAIGLGIFFWGTYSINAYKARGIASQKWPTVQGRIIESRAEENVSTDEDGNKSYSIFAVIKYEYIVNGVRYTHDQLDWEDNLYRSTLATAQKLADSYPVGMIVLVHYDPKKPGFALLDTTFLPERPDEVGIGYFIASGAVLAIAAALIYAHTGLLFRVPGWLLIIASMVVFMGGGVLTFSVGVYFAVLIGFGFVSFGIGAIVLGRQ